MLLERWWRETNIRSTFVLNFCKSSRYYPFISNFSSLDRKKCIYIVKSQCYQYFYNIVIITSVSSSVWIAAAVASDTKWNFAILELPEGRIRRAPRTTPAKIYGAKTSNKLQDVFIVVSLPQGDSAMQYITEEDSLVLQRHFTRQITKGDFPASSDNRFMRCRQEARVPGARSLPTTIGFVGKVSWHIIVPFRFETEKRVYYARNPAR